MACEQCFKLRRKLRLLNAKIAFLWGEVLYQSNIVEEFDEIINELLEKYPAENDPRINRDDSKDKDAV